MTNTDKTQRKLVDSVRKTKAGVAAKTKAARSGNSASATTKKKSSVPHAINATADPYQSGRRVWPD